MDVVILAGGKSTRMEDVLPKPIVSVRGKPVLFYQIEYFKDKVNNIIISVGHRHQEIIDFVNSHYHNNNIKFCIENEPLGTAGGIKKALLMSDSDKVIVLNCDDITDINISDLEKLNENHVCVAHPMLPFGLIKESLIEVSAAPPGTWQHSVSLPIEKCLTSKSLNTLNLKRGFTLILIL